MIIPSKDGTEHIKNLVKAFFENMATSKEKSTYISSTQTCPSSLPHPHALFPQITMITMDHSFADACHLECLDLNAPSTCFSLSYLLQPVAFNLNPQIPHTVICPQT
ncbi:hypothetical protein PoB_007675000 [Plakobranchus ocellatus]|uniref:Uncharacterized protein n=1 Tax=Plakobranchus ocellatus TaxID=259542 RepID=A0AAV4E1G4_9GAST|nr:hypothetical protein PoB_007675000 [Plakobranchus ocellatus]